MARSIPWGFKLAADFDTRKPGASKKGESPSGIYRVILQACTQGTIRAYKDAGRWIVNEADVHELKKDFEAIAAKEATEAPVDCSDVAKEIRFLCGVMAEIRDAIADLKTPVVVEPKQETGPY